MASNSQLKPGPPTLGQFMMREIVPNAIKKGLFGGPHILFPDLVNICVFLFQSNAIIGRVRRSQIDLLAKLFTEPGRESDLIPWLRQRSSKQLNEYKDVFGEEPTAFQTYITGLEYQTAGITLPFGNAQLRGSLKEHTKQVEKQSKYKVPLDFADQKLQMTAVEGIGFGIEYPELTEKMYREANENIDRENGNNARQAGLDIPWCFPFQQNPDVITLEEQENIALSMVAAYASEYHPQLVTPLDLDGYLE